VSAHADLASALRYPTNGETHAALLRYPGFAGRDPADLEELYTRTFDVNPVSSLETGWHLFGEDYNRGAFLVRMRGLLRECGIEEGAELPDHLESVLRLLDVLDEERAGELVRQFVLPAVRKMRVPLERGDNPYGAVLAEVDRTLRERWGEPIEWAAPAATLPYDCGGCHGIR